MGAGAPEGSSVSEAKATSEPALASSKGKTSLVEGEGEGERMKAVVVGCGAVGLSMALELLEAGWEVSVLGEKLSPNTTSDGSGGYWRPVFLEMDDTKLLEISEYSFKRMIEIMRDAPDVGMQLVSGYEFYKQEKEPEIPCWSHVVFGFRRATREEVGLYGPPGATHAFSYTTLSR